MAEERDHAERAGAVPAPADEEAGTSSVDTISGFREKAEAVEDDRAAMPTELDVKRRGAEDSEETHGLRKATLIPASSQGGQKSDKKADFYVGAIVDERYKIDSVIAEGGMGMVYRATHRVIDRPVAVKILRPDFAKDREVTERFLTEAKAASAIGHASIVDVFDFGELPDGSAYLAMEYVDGKPLAKLLKGKKPMPVARVIKLGKRIAAGLSAAHDAGIVHRDLKPDNLVITRHDGDDDFVKILDFGIAKVAKSQNRLTRAGTIFGTPQYMSPEQGSGGEVDHRADIYSLGVILYEMTSGVLPFDAENPLGLVTQHMYEKPPLISEMVPPPQDVPPGLEAIILKCLSKKPEHRYHSMRKLIEELEIVEQGELPAAVAELAERKSEFDVGQERFTEVVAEAQRSAKRPVWPKVAVFMLITGLAAGTVYAYRNRPPPDDTVEGLAEIPVTADTPRAGAAAKERSVMIIVLPIDAHVFQNGEDLGEVPVLVPVAQGQKVELVAKRQGFDDHPITLDGSQGRVVVNLKPTPGVDPVVPVPKAGIEDIDLSSIEGLEKPDGGKTALRQQLDRELKAAAELAAGATPSAPSSEPPKNPPPKPEWARPEEPKKLEPIVLPPITSEKPAAPGPAPETPPPWEDPGG